MKLRKVLAIFVTTAIILSITSISSLAATFNLNASFDGQTMSLTSDDLAVNALNILPGETDISKINIENKGKEKIKLYMSAKLVDDQTLAEILDVTVTDSKNNELYKGKYDETKKFEIDLDKTEKETLTIKTEMPATAGNEYQGKEANVKFVFQADGEGVEIEPEPTPEAPKTNQSRVIIYSVLIGIVVILIIALIILSFNKKRKEENK